MVQLTGLRKHLNTAKLFLVIYYLNVLLMRQKQLTAHLSVPVQSLS